MANVIEKPLPSVPADFTDNDEISPWALDAVGKVQAAGIMQGVSRGAFAPNEQFTREQCIVTLMRLNNDYEVLYADWYITAYMRSGTPCVYTRNLAYYGASAVLVYGEEAPPDQKGYWGRWHYTPHGAFIIGGYLGDMAYMPSYRYKDGVFEQIFHKSKLIDVRFAGDYLYMVFSGSSYDNTWDARENSNLLQINLIDMSERWLGAPYFVYGWSEDYIPTEWGGFTYDPAKMEWEVREDGIYIFGFWQNPDFNVSGEASRGESGFYLVAPDGNGHRRAD